MLNYQRVCSWFRGRSWKVPHVRNYPDHHLKCRGFKKPSASLHSLHLKCACVKNLGTPKFDIRGPWKTPVPDPPCENWLIWLTPHETLQESPSGIGTSDFLSCRCHSSLIFSLLDRWSCCNSSCQAWCFENKPQEIDGSSWFINIFPWFPHLTKSFKSPVGSCLAPSLRSPAGPSVLGIVTEGAGTTGARLRARDPGPRCVKSVGSCSSSPPEVTGFVGYPLLD